MRVVRAAPLPHLCDAGVTYFFDRLFTLYANIYDPRAVNNPGLW